MTEEEEEDEDEEIVNEDILDNDPRYIHFDITVTHGCSRSKIQTMSTHISQKAAAEVEKKKVKKYFKARQSRDFMSRFAPIAFESTGTM